MAGISAPQSQAGIMSFYDAPSKGPTINPKVVLVVVFIFAAIVIIFQHFGNL